MPGLSDIDLFVVCDPDPGSPGSAARRIHERHERLTTGSRAAELLIDRPLVVERDELRDVIGANTLTYGLPETGHRGSRTTVYAEGSHRVDHVRMTELPGLYGTTTTWRHLRGRRLQINEPPRTVEATRLAAWLDLVFWWRVAIAACRGNFGPRGGYTSAKLIAEPARIWLLLTHGEEYPQRAKALERALECLPEEEQVLRLALDLHRSAINLPPMHLDEIIPGLARFSDRIATIIGDAVVADGVTEAALDGDPWELTPTWDGALPPQPGAAALCDWRGIVASPLGDEWFAEADGSATEPEAVARAAGRQDEGEYFMLRTASLMVFPGPTWERTRRRGVMSPASEPVIFALDAKKARAEFPNHPGLSLADITRRAVAERKAWLATAGREPTLTELLLTARVGLIRETFLEGTTHIPVTLSAIARSLGERSDHARLVAETALDQVRRRRPEASTAAALQALVTALPGLDH